MSHRLCAGFNCPVLAVPAPDEIGASPESADNACRASGRPFDPYSSASVILLRSERQSRAVGVAHDAAVDRSVPRTSTFASRWAPLTPSANRGVGQLASFAAPGSLR